MATTAFKGNPVNTVGELPAPGASAPAFDLVGDGLSSLTSADVSGRVVLNIFPSIDTGVCAASVRKFNELAAGLENTTVINVSQDLPMAQARFCGAEGIERVATGSATDAIDLIVRRQGRTSLVVRQLEVAVRMDSVVAIVTLALVLCLMASACAGLAPQSLMDTQAVRPMRNARRYSTTWMRASHWCGIRTSTTRPATTRQRRRGAAARGARRGRRRGALAGLSRKDAALARHRRRSRFVVLRRRARAAQRARGTRGRQRHSRARARGRRRCGAAGRRLPWR